MARKASKAKANPSSETVRCISLEGVRVHNLRGFDLKIRHQSLTVVCGVSGSGKSSLAFDTLYAEGQRRYIETFSPSARQFLDRIERPDVDRITGLPPAIAIRQQHRSEGTRSTLGTKTEIIDYLRVLFAKLATTVCRSCGTIIRPMSPEAASDELLRHFDGRLLILARGHADQDQSPAMIADLIRSGFTRIVYDGQTVRLDDFDPNALRGSFFIVIDRLKCEAAAKSRIAEAIQSAMNRSDGRCDVLAENQLAGASIGSTVTMSVDNAFWHQATFNSRRVCAGCERQFPDPARNISASILRSVHVARAKAVA